MAVSGAFPGSRRGWFQRRRIHGPVCASGCRDRRTPGGVGSRAGSVQYARGQHEGGRAGLRITARARGRLPEVDRACARVCATPGLQERACHLRRDTGGCAARAAPRRVREEPRVGCAAGGTRWHHAGDRTDQHAQHSRIFPQPSGGGARRVRRDRRAEPEGADGLLSLPDVRGRSGDEAEEVRA